MKYCFWCHWLLGITGKPKKILLYALKIRHTLEKLPPITLIEHITSEHNILPIRQTFLQFRKCEQNIFRSGKLAAPCVVIV